MARTRGRRAITGVAGIALAVALTGGCSLIGGGDDGGGKGSAAIPSISMGPNGKVAGAVASVTRPYGAYNLQVDIVSLQRVGKVVRLVFVVIPHSGGGTSDDLDKGTFGASGEFGQDKDVSDVALVDTDGMQVYDTMTVGSGDKAYCACSHNLDDYSIGNPTTLYADFPAPPDSVKKLTVLLPHLGPVPGVKVTS